MAVAPRAGQAPATPKKYFTPQAHNDVIKSIALLQGVELLLKYLPCNNWANHPDITELRAQSQRVRALLEEELPKK